MTQWSHTLTYLRHVMTRERPVVFVLFHVFSWIFIFSFSKFMSKKYITAPFTPYQFEQELSKDLELDDATILERRYQERIAKEKKKEEEEKGDVTTTTTTPSSVKSIKSQTQWTRALDVVQEHFSSHVILDGVSHRIPPNIYALKHAAKRDWILYKKRECERRKRIREKIEREKKNERYGKPANVLLAMVDSCEACRRLYVTVNLFWGVTLCDSCYFNPDIINELMTSRLEAAEHKVKMSSENIADQVVRYRDNSSSSSEQQNTTPIIQNPLLSKKRKQRSSAGCMPDSSSASTNASFFNVVPFIPPSKEDAIVVVPSPPPSLPPSTPTTSTTPFFKKPRKQTPPTSPGEPPGNELEKMEVAEGITKCNDNPYFDDLDDFSLSSSPLPDTPQRIPSPPPCNTFAAHPSHMKEIFREAGENSNAIIGSSPNAIYIPFSQNSIFEGIEQFGLDEEDYQDHYSSYSQHASHFSQWYNECVEGGGYGSQQQHQ